METFIVYTLVLVTMFAVAFLTKRRFGLLGLGLATGSVLSVALRSNLETLVDYIGIRSQYFNVYSFLIVVILLPAVIFLFKGSKYKTIQTRIVGAILFAVLGFTLLINPLSQIVPFQGLGMELYANFIDYGNYIITATITAAVIDVFLTKHAKSDDKHKKH